MYSIVMFGKQKKTREGAGRLAETLCLRLPQKRQRAIVSSANSV